MDTRIIEALLEAVERFPRISGILLGIAAHPIFSALIYR